MNQNEIKLAINKDISAPVDQVFRAWTNADVLAQWCGAQGMPVQATRIDAVVGGEYMIHLQDPETGDDRIVSGTYEEIIENKGKPVNMKNGCSNEKNFKIEFK